MIKSTSTVETILGTNSQPGKNKWMYWLYATLELKMSSIREWMKSASYIILYTQYTRSPYTRRFVTAENVCRGLGPFSSTEHLNTAYPTHCLWGSKYMHMCLYIMYDVIERFCVRLHTKVDNCICLFPDVRECTDKEGWDICWKTEYRQV